MRLMVEFIEGDGYIMFNDTFLFDSKAADERIMEVNFQLPNDRKRMFINQAEFAKFLKAAEVFVEGD